VEKPMAPSFASHALAMLLLGACTTVTSASRPPAENDVERINLALRDREVELRLGSDHQEVVVGTAVLVEPAGVVWTDRTGQRLRAPAELLHSLNYLSPEHPRVRGFWEGGGMGVAGGGALGVVIGLASGDDPPCGSEQFFCLRGSRGEKAVVGGVILGLLGLVVGGSIGVAVGHHDQVEFTATR